MPSVRGQPGASVSVRLGVQPWELPSPVMPKAVKHWSLRSVQVKLIKMGGRLVRHSRRLIFQEVSVPRRLFEGVLDRIGRFIAGAKLREGTTTILPRGRALQGVGLSSMRFHPIGGGPKTTKISSREVRVAFLPADLVTRADNYADHRQVRPPICRGLMDAPWRLVLWLFWKAS